MRSGDGCSHRALQVHFSAVLAERRPKHCLNRASFAISKGFCATRFLVSERARPSASGTSATDCGIGHREGEAGVERAAGTRQYVCDSHV